MQFEVIMYETESGDCPVKEFLDELAKDNAKLQAKTTRMIKLLEEYGNDLREPFSEPLEDGILELRTIQGNNISRVLYFFVVGKKIVLTHGFVKKTQKTPRAEIERAKRYRADYINRQGE